MSMVSRIKAIWELSAEKEQKEMIEDDFILEESERPRQSAVFIPRIVQSPVDAIVNEPTQ